MRLLSALMLLASCSSPDAGPDAPTNACGAGPYVYVDGAVASFTTKLPIPEASLTLDACADHAPFIANNLGHWTIQMTSGAGFSPRIAADGFITTRTGLSSVTADFDAGTSLRQYARSIPRGCSSIAGHGIHAKPNAGRPWVLVRAGRLDRTPELKRLLVK